MTSRPVWAKSTGSQKDDIQREMRKKIKRHLRASGMETDRIESLASEIVDLAKVRQER